MAWLRIRVSAETGRKVRWLRKQGVNISKVVGDAIEAEYERSIAKLKRAQSKGSKSRDGG